jgi:hypothetical protein
MKITFNIDFLDVKIKYTLCFTCIKISTYYYIYDFRIKTMFCSSLPPVACIWWCIFVLFCLSSSCVLFTQCCQFLWIVHVFIAPSLFSNVYLHLLLWLTKYVIISKIIYIIIAAVITSSVNHSWSCFDYSSLWVINCELPTMMSSHLLHLY